MLLAPARPARALPGQTSAQFRAWAGKIVEFRNIEHGTDELSGWPDYHILSADHGVAWDFRALEDGRGAIREERFSMTVGPGDIGNTPVRHDGTGYGYTFFSTVMGSAVASDFRHAKLVAPFPKKPGDPRYYRGAKYGWIDYGGKMLALDTPKWFDTAIATAEHCAQPGVRCSE
jgi:hypothetical protein